MSLEFNIIYCHHEHDEGEPCNDDCRSCRDDINEECDANQLETLPGMEY